MFKIFTLALMFPLFFLTAAQGMLSDGMHKIDDYENLASESVDFSAACLVHDKYALISQTGVLITPTTVVTAAHGVVGMVQQRNLAIPEKTPLKVNNIWVRFKTPGKTSCQVLTYEVDEVFIDGRYTEKSGLESKYDIALIKLKKPVTAIEPAKLFNSCFIKNPLKLTVVTWGNGDLKQTIVSPRAFRLYEYDSFQQIGYDEEALSQRRSVLKSSLFFKPTFNLNKPSITANEEEIRCFEGTQNWLRDGKKPYGLALPGTSGAPVFVRLTINGAEQDYLFGIITSFSHLSGLFQSPSGKLEADYLLNSPQSAFNKYQTIFALLYQEDGLTMNSEEDGWWYYLDKSFIRLTIRAGIREPLPIVNSGQERQNSRR